MRILFMGTPDFALKSLKALYEAKYDIIGVVTNIDKPKGRGMKLVASPVKEYALEKGVDDSKWNLVTGDKKEIYYLARKSYLAVKTGKPEDIYDMVHTENFILIDKNKRIRGFYDGTNLDQPSEDDPETKNMQQLLEDILWLSKNQ